MSFYGRVNNVTTSDLKFDKIYPSRAEMEANAENDGVFIGRYILVEYSTEPYGVDSTQITQKPVSTSPMLPKDDYSAIINDASKTSLEKNYDIDKRIYNKDTTSNWKGYDSTVWMKTSVQFDDEAQVRYVQVAELNSVVPTLNITTVAPSYTVEQLQAEGRKINSLPGFDTEHSTNVNYELVMQPIWNFADLADVEYAIENEDSVEEIFSGQVGYSNIREYEKVYTCQPHTIYRLDNNHLGFKCRLVKKEFSENAQEDIIRLFESSESLQLEFIDNYEISTTITQFSLKGLDVSVKQGSNDSSAYVVTIIKEYVDTIDNNTSDDFYQALYDISQYYGLAQQFVDGQQPLSGLLDEIGKNIKSSKGSFKTYKSPIIIDINNDNEVESFNKKFTFTMPIIPEMFSKMYDLLYLNEGNTTPTGQDRNLNNPEPKSVMGFRNQLLDIEGGKIPAKAKDGSIQSFSMELNKNEIPIYMGVDENDLPVYKGFNLGIEGAGSIPVYSGAVDGIPQYKAFDLNIGDGLIPFLLNVGSDGVPDYQGFKLRSNSEAISFNQNSIEQNASGEYELLVNVNITSKDINVGKDIDILGIQEDDNILTVLEQVETLISNLYVTNEENNKIKIVDVALSSNYTIDNNYEGDVIKPGDSLNEAFRKVEENAGQIVLNQDNILKNNGKFNNKDIVINSNLEYLTSNNLNGGLSQQFEFTISTSEILEGHNNVQIYCKADINELNIPQQITNITMEFSKNYQFYDILKQHLDLNKNVFIYWYDEQNQSQHTNYLELLDVSFGFKNLDKIYIEFNEPFGQNKNLLNFILNMSGDMSSIQALELSPQENTEYYKININNFKQFAISLNIPFITFENCTIKSNTLSTASEHFKIKTNGLQHFSFYNCTLHNIGFEMSDTSIYKTHFVYKNCYINNVAIIPEDVQQGQSYQIEFNSSDLKNSIIKYGCNSSLILSNNTIENCQFNGYDGIKDTTYQIENAESKVYLNNKNCFISCIIDLASPITYDNQGMARLTLTWTTQKTVECHVSFINNYFPYASYNFLHPEQSNSIAEYPIFLMGNYGEFYNPNIQNYVKPNDINLLNDLVIK